jgi:pimeloyl-ACP methyl ester carboxylesterase
MTSPRFALEDADAALSAPWGGISNIADLDGDVHWVNFGGPEDPNDTTPPIVLVHGLGGSHLNWVRVAPTLAKHTRVYAVDLPGFGLTQAHGRTTHVHSNTALLNRFIDTVVGKPVILFGNSMGGMVSALATDARPDSVAGLVLVDPALPLPIRIPDPVVAAQFLVYALPYLGEQAMSLGRRKLTDEQLAAQMTNLCFVDPTRADSEVIAAGAALAKIRRGFSTQDADFLQAARSLLTVLARPQKYRKALRDISVPTLLLHGERDRLVSVAAARSAAAAHPHWTTIILGDTGHTPQLELPDEFNRHVLAWLSHTDLITT